MEKAYYSLRINTDETNYDTVSEILNIQPQNLNKGWVYEIENASDVYIDHVEKFLDILEGNYEKLEYINISRDDISIWLIYEYNGQCNLEFFPKNLKRLGDNKISLCVSCYEAGD